MDLPALNTRTDAAVATLPLVDVDGSLVMSVMIKERFWINEDGSVTSGRDAEVRFVDVPGGEEGKSVKYPADVCLRKPSTDVVVVGHAMAPDCAPVTELDCYIEVGPVKTALRVFGPRVWYEGATGIVLTPPEEFTTRALVWEEAFGGTDYEGDRLAMEDRNPIGRGLAVDGRALVHEPGPSVEDPTDLIASHRSRPRPAGIAPVPRTFQPRLGYAGTMDQAWQDTRQPLPPLDFDDRHNQVAPPWMITPQPLRGGERARVLGMHPDGALEFALPRRSFYVGAELDGSMQEHRPMLDTVLVEPSDRRLEMVWRSAIPIPRPMRRLRMIQVHERKPLS